MIPQRAPRKQDTRGVNTVVGYVLALSITTILISLLILSTTSFVTSQQRSVIHTEMQIVGQHAASAITDMDRVVRAQNTTNADIQRTVSFPDQMAGVFYSISVSNVTGRPDTYALKLRTNSPPVTWRVLFRSETEVKPTTVAGGNLVIEYDATTDQLVIQNA